MLWFLRETQGKPTSCFCLCRPLPILCVFSNCDRKSIEFAKPGALFLKPVKGSAMVTAIISTFKRVGMTHAESIRPLDCVLVVAVWAHPCLGAKSIDTIFV